MAVEAPERTMVRRNDQTVKLDAEVARDAKIVAAYKDMSLAEYLSELIRPVVARDLESEHERKTKPPKGKGGPK